jgi:aspartyl-tRNA(Asn)/glutamyl-tRNA(Gln) amidotransferase subunit A
MDAAVVQRVRAAGGVMLGKANLYELQWAATTEQDHFKPVRNPWNLKLRPGGSSSGSGAGVAAGLMMASIGSDSGGSIRHPAAFCGVSGLMPTAGRVTTAGIPRSNFSLGSTGPLARTAEDTAIMLEILAGHDPADPRSSSEPVPPYRELLSRGIRGLKIGICPSYMEAAGVDTEVKGAFEEALKVFRSLGTAVSEVEVPYIAYSKAVAWTILLSEALHVHFEILRTQREQIGSDFVRSMSLGAFLSAQDYLRALQARTLIARELATVFNTVHVLMMPANPAAASPPSFRTQPADPKVARSGVAYTTPFNILGAPAVSIPSGFNRQGLPTAVQLAGRPFDEGTILTAAHQYQLATNWTRHRPNLP